MNRSNQGIPITTHDHLQKLVDDHKCVVVDYGATLHRVTAASLQYRQYKSVISMFARGVLSEYISSPKKGWNMKSLRNVAETPDRVETVFNEDLIAEVDFENVK